MNTEHKSWFIPARWMLFFGAFFLTSSVLYGEIAASYIDPQSFTKIHYFFGYNLKQKVEGRGDLKSENYQLGNRYCFGLGFDMPLYKYLNAGLNVNFWQGYEYTPSLHLDFFLKPQFPIKLGPFHMAFYSKLAAGLSNGFRHLLQSKNQIETGGGPIGPLPTQKPEYEEINSFFHLGVGGNLSGSIGFEFFPITRFGIFVEYGYNQAWLAFNKQNLQTTSYLYKFSTYTLKSQLGWLGIVYII